MAIQSFVLSTGMLTAEGRSFILQMHAYLAYTYIALLHDISMSCDVLLHM